jgi:hypothetical protein
MKHVAAICVMVVICWTGQAMAGVIDSVNANGDPRTFAWGCKSIGWLYTAPKSYIMTGVQTRFADSFHDYDIAFDITVEIYDALPNSGGQLLRTTAFTSAPHGTFVGGVFEALPITEGDDYFIGFRGIWGAPTNSSDDGDIELPCYLDGKVADGMYVERGTYDLMRYPALQFEGEVPEPATLLLLGLGGIAVVGSRSAGGPARD